MTNQIRYALVMKTITGKESTDKYSCTVNFTIEKITVHFSMKNLLALYEWNYFHCWQCKPQLLLPLMDYNIYICIYIKHNAANKNI